MTEPTESDRTSVVGLMADPGMPWKFASALADELADELNSATGGRWSVEVDQETLPLGPDGEIRLTQHAPRLLRQHEWNFVLYLTDLPTYDNDVPLLYDVSPESPAALVSVPVVGAVRVKSRLRELILNLVRSASGRDGMVAPGIANMPSAARPGRLNQLRLLAGMVLNNRPRRLATSLSGVIVAAAGSGAFGIFFGSLIALADELAPPRLLLVALLSIATLTTWLITRNGLWNAGRDPDEPGNRRLDNAATVLTVGSGVILMFLLLTTAMFVLSVVVLDPAFMGSQLEREADFVDYLRLAWLSGCLGTFAGALGSNFDSENSVREATYSLRWHERRQLFDTYANREEEEQMRIDREYDNPQG